MKKVLYFLVLSFFFSQFCFAIQVEVEGKATEIASSDSFEKQREDELQYPGEPSPSKNQELERVEEIAPEEQPPSELEESPEPEPEILIPQEQEITQEEEAPIQQEALTEPQESPEPEMETPIPPIPPAEEQETDKVEEVAAEEAEEVMPEARETTSTEIKESPETETPISPLPPEQEITQEEEAPIQQEAAGVEAPAEEIAPEEQEKILAEPGESPEPEIETPSPPATTAAKTADVLSLTLENVIKHVIRYNPLVEEARLNWLASYRTARATWGDFEPEFVGNYGLSDLERENTTLQALAQGGSREFSERNVEYGAGIEGKVFTGGDYRLGYTLNRQQSSLITDDEYESFLGVELEQPLMKGAWFGAPLAGIRVARKDFAIAFQNYRKELMLAILRAESAYWNLAFAQEQYRITSESVMIAKDLVGDSKARFEVGKMSELDLLEAEAGLAERLFLQADSEQNLLDAIRELKLLLSNEEIPEIQRVCTVDSLVPPVLEDFSIEEERATSMEWALSNQPDSLIRLRELEKQKILLGYQKAQRLPQLNVKGSYGFNALGETGEGAWEKLKDRDYPAWNVNLEVRIPLLFGVRERNELVAARLKKEVAEQKLKSTEYEIVNTIDILIQRIDAFRRRAENIRKVAEFKKRLLDIEFSRLKEGKSNVRIIYEVEEELAQARERELESIVRYRESLLQLAFIRGSILQDEGLETIQDGIAVLSEIATNIHEEKIPAYHLRAR